MTTPETDFDFKVVPLNMLPSELDPHSTPKKIEDEKQIIRDEILSKSNEDIIAADVDGKTLKLLRSGFGLEHSMLSRSTSASHQVPKEHGILMLGKQII